MTWLEFELDDAFTRWLEHRTRDYEAYYTTDTVYAVPKVSTRPVLYGELTPANRDAVIETIRGILPADDVYPITALDADERQAEPPEPAETT